MGLDELKPGNTKRAKETAIKVFKTFVKSEDVEFDYVKQCIEQDGTGNCLVSVLDKFGMYLAFNEGKKGKPLARNTSMQYYRQSKMWLFELFPVQRHIVEAKLLSMGKTLERFCMKRDGKVVNKAPPCSKRDLRKMMLYLYESACSPSDYQDAALLCLMWHLFGRASDLSLVHKQNLSVDAADVFFVRFIRMKTSEEQGLSLFPDPDFVTCPLQAIAMALITQSAPTPALIDNLPEIPLEAAVNLSPATPLLEVLNHPSEFAALDATATRANCSTKPAAAVPTIYTHVNRLLDRVASAAGVTEPLTSHSFRRGGAQHVNGCDGLTERWIFDRGAWNMSTTNKGFNYIFNTSRQDHMIGKALSGFGTGADVDLLNLDAFDAETRLKIAGVQRLLFATCYKMDSSKYNISPKVADVLTAYLVLHYPLLKTLRSGGLAVRRLEMAVVHAGAAIAELLAWSSHLATYKKPAPTPRKEPPTPMHKEPSNESKIIDHQRSVINQLVLHIKRQDERMDVIEAKQEGGTTQDTNKKRQQEPSQEQEKPKRRRTSVTHLHATWFAWYAQEPFGLADAPKRQRSNAKQLVAFMKLFVADDLKLDPSAVDYRDQVLALGKQAEAAVLAFLGRLEIKSRGSTAVRKHLHDLYQRGALNDKITRLQQLRRADAVQDPDRQDVLELVANT
ncbi:hypothetical protein AM587_10002075 [Phytophthora nicotianae]|uniref:Uncharacterized protein n=1 Tax=Phytophthora nicotianae TaxID=4792 RepID=A0A0W8BVC6_PHYNI|nr:hypothetical protein AM587_10002075 [Phytophthora nicotianae]